MKKPVNFKQMSDHIRRVTTQEPEYYRQIIDHQGVVQTFNSKREYLDYLDKRDKEHAQYS